MLRALVGMRDATPAFVWDEDVVNELRITADHLETLLSEQEGRYDECMENTKLN